MGRTPCIEIGLFFNGLGQRELAWRLFSGQVSGPGWTAKVKLIPEVNIARLIVIYSKLSKNHAKYVQVFVAVGLIFFFLPAKGQQARETFGKTGSSTRNLTEVFSSENFDVYYYDDRRKVAGERFNI